MKAWSALTWGNCCTGKNEEKKHMLREDLSEVVMLSDQSLKAGSESTVSTRENSQLTFDSSQDELSISGTKTVKAGVVSEPSIPEAARVNIRGRSSEPSPGFEEHSTSIEVALDKSEHGPLCWCVDATIHRQLIIKDTMDTVAYERCPEVVRTQLAAYDWIKSVNGLPGSSAELSVMLQNNTRLNIQLLRPTIIDVRIEANRRLGAVVQYTKDSLGCMIHEIRSGGQVATWNSLNPSQLVKRMDRIISVNGRYASAPELSVMLKRRCAKTIEVLSYP